MVTFLIIYPDCMRDEAPNHSLAKPNNDLNPFLTFPNHSCCRQIGYLKHKLLDSFLAPLATLRYPPLDGNSAELMFQTYSKLLGQVGWKLRPKPKASDDMGCKHAAIAPALHGLGKLVGVQEGSLLCPLLHSMALAKWLV